MNAHGDRADMICNSPHRAAMLGIKRIIRPDNFAHGFAKRFERIDFKVALHPLQHRSGSFESHAGIDIFHRQRTQIIGRVSDTIELRENKIPDFDFASTAGRVIINFTARPTNAIRSIARGTGWPEVFVFVVSANLFLGQADFIFPNVECFVIVEKNGNA